METVQLNNWVNAEVAAVALKQAGFDAEEVRTLTQFLQKNNSDLWNINPDDTLPESLTLNDEDLQENLFNR